MEKCRTHAASLQPTNYSRSSTQPENKNSHSIQKRHLYVLKHLNQKLATENPISSQADKGKTTVIINSEEYSNKIHTFLTTNNFRTLPRDPTDRYQKLVHKTMQECNLITDERQIIPNTKETLTTHTQSTN
jgi:hypothetical protein